MAESTTLWPIIKNHSPGSNYLMGVFSQLQGHGQKAWIIKAYTIKSAHSGCRGIPSAFGGDAKVHKRSLHQLCFPYRPTWDLSGKVGEARPS